MNELLIIKERDKITRKDESRKNDSRKELNEKRFNELRRFAKNFNKRNKGKESFDPFKLEDDSVTSNGYVGVIQLSDGFQIQILPKIFEVDNGKENETAQKLLIAMMQKTKIFSSIDMKNASLKSDNINICELFIYNYIQEIKRLVRRGIKLNYTAEEDNLSVFKGKLIVSEHIRHNMCHKERFYVVFDEYNKNIPENRIIKSVLTKLSRLTANSQNASEIKRLLIDFADIDLSRNYKKDFAGITINRNNKDYDTIIQLSRMFLDGESVTMSHGRITAWSFLLPMWMLYEKYVAYYAKKVFEKKEWKVMLQNEGTYLFENQWFALRPDIVLRKDDNTVIILDTKWKLLNKKKFNYGIDEKDMYQMLAYACRYKAKYIYLLYPENPNPEKKIENIEFINDQMTVKVRFIKLYPNNTEESKNDILTTVEESINDLSNDILKTVEENIKK